MHRLIYVALVLGGLAYGAVAWRIYQHDLPTSAVLSPNTPLVPFDHPETNLRVVREAFADGNYSNDLAPFLEAARRQAPASYQSWFLTASFHASRAERPEMTSQAFEAAVERFPANGRLRLGIADWLLRARSSLPYRRYSARDSTDDAAERRSEALVHLREALRLEPELLGASVSLLSRFDIPLEDWARYLPDNEATTRQILVVLDSSSRVADRRPYLNALMESDETSASLLKEVVAYASRWAEDEIWTRAANRWLDRAEFEEKTPDISRAAELLAQSHIERTEHRAALAAVRRGVELLEERQLARTLGVDLLTRVGTLFFQHHELQTSQTLFVEALEIAPRDMRARIGLARVHGQLGERVEAIRLLRRVLELDPRHSEATELMARLVTGVH